MVRAGSSVIPAGRCKSVRVMPDLVEPYTRRACSTHFTFQAASHSTFAIAGVASLSLAHGGRGECRRAAGPRGDPAKRRKIGLSLDTRE